MSNITELSEVLAESGIDVSSVQSGLVSGFDMTVLVWSLTFSLFGFVYWRYGKKQEHKVAYYSGITLMLYPYFIHNLYFLIPIGIIMIALPFIFKNE